MPESPPPNADRPQRSSRTLVFIIIGVIVLSIAAFLILKPDPSGAGHSTSTSDH